MYYYIETSCGIVNLEVHGNECMPKTDEDRRRLETLYSYYDLSVIKEYNNNLWLHIALESDGENSYGHQEYKLIPVGKEG